MALGVVNAHEAVPKTEERMKHTEGGLGPLGGKSKGSGETISKTTKKNFGLMG